MGKLINLSFLRLASYTSLIRWLLFICDPIAIYLNPNLVPRAFIVERVVDGPGKDWV